MVVKKNATKEKRMNAFCFFSEKKALPWEGKGGVYFPKSHFPNNLLVCAIWLISRQSATIGIATPTEQRMSSRKLG